VQCGGFVTQFGLLHLTRIATSVSSRRALSCRPAFVRRPQKLQSLRQRERRTEPRRAFAKMLGFGSRGLRVRDGVLSIGATSGSVCPFLRYIRRAYGGESRDGGGLERCK
jgi:hypothetical protein